MLYKFYSSLSKCKIFLSPVQEFEDLDEIIARHIQPMAANVREIMSFKYYRDSEGGKRDIMDKILSEEKKRSNFKYVSMKC